MPTISANGLEMGYRLDGDGEETIMLINGLADEKESWAAQVEAFTGAGYRVLTLDNRGIGETEQTPGPYTIRQMADDTKGLVDALGITDFHLLGFSMGGMIAQEYALAYGDDLRSLILYATYAEPGAFCDRLLVVWEDMALNSGMESVVRDVLLWCFTPAFYEEQPEVAALFDDGVADLGLTAESFLAQLKGAQAHNATGRLGDITAPSLVLAGESDILIPPAQSRRIHQHMPGAEWQTVAGGHGACWENPDAFNALILDYVGRYSA
jgi:3-oxoadipate enol-lactonase